MGAWGVGPYENDGAGDFESALIHEHDDRLGVLRDALETALRAGDYLEVDAGQAAVAAAALLASITGLKAVDPNARVRSAIATIAADRAAGLTPLAMRALQRVTLSSESSELYELWLDSDEYQAWKRSIEQIRTHLRAQSAAAAEGVDVDEVDVADSDESTE